MSLDLRCHTFSGQLFHAAYETFVYSLAISLFQRLGYRVVRIIFGHSCIFDEFFLAETLFRKDIFYVENSFRKSSRLIHNYPLYLRHGFQVVASLDQHACLRSAAYASEKAQGHRYDQGAWAGYYEEV